MAVACKCGQILHSIEEEYAHAEHSPTRAIPMGMPGCNMCNGFGWYMHGASNLGYEPEICPCVKTRGRLFPKPKRKVKVKELEFVCRKCDHHLFCQERKGWVKKVTQLPCPNCGESAGYSGRWSLLGYGRFADWKGRIIE